MTNNLENMYTELNNYINLLHERNKDLSIKSNDINIEFCIYLVNNLINNLMKFCKYNDMEIPENKIIFCIRFLGQEYCTEKTLFLLHGLFYKDKIILNYYFPSIIGTTLEFLNQLNKRINILEENIKEKKLIKL